MPMVFIWTRRFFKRQKQEKFLGEEKIIGYSRIRRKKFLQQKISTSIFWSWSFRFTSTKEKLILFWGLMEITIVIQQARANGIVKTHHCYRWNSIE